MLEQAAGHMLHAGRRHGQPGGAQPSPRGMSFHALAWKHLGIPARRHAVERAASASAGDSACGNGEAAGCVALAEDLLTWSHACAAGLETTYLALIQAEARMERRYWQASHGLYADHTGADGELAGYRSQRANQRACEALLAAFEASGEPRYLRRAETLAYNITVRQAGLTGGVVWEHYHADWSPDWDYERDAGADPGQQIAWALLLLRLERHPVAMAACGGWMRPRAAQLFDIAMDRGWDHVHGGLSGGLDIVDQAARWMGRLEIHLGALAAAALLAHRGDDDGDHRYLAWYDKLWRHTWPHLLRGGEGRDRLEIAHLLLRGADALEPAPAPRRASASASATVQATAVRMP